MSVANVTSTFKTSAGVNSDVTKRVLRVFACMILSLLMLGLSDCGSSNKTTSTTGGGGGGGTGTGGGGTPTSAVPETLYAAGGKIFAFNVNTSSGALTPVSGSPFDATSSSNPNTAASATVSVNRAGTLLFSANNMSQGSNLAGWEVDVFTINAKDGSLIFQSTTPGGSTGSTLAAMMVDPSGRFLYASNGAGQGIFGYSIAPSGNLTLIAGSPFSAANVPGEIAIDGQSRFLYVGDQSGAVWGFSINSSSGVLSPVPGSPYQVRAAVQASGKVPLVMSPAITPSGQFLYVADLANNQIDSFSVDQNSGALTAIGSPAKGQATSPFAITVDPSGKYVYGTDWFNDIVMAYTIQSDGTLTAMAGAPFTLTAAGAPETDIKIDAAGKYLFTANTTQSNLSVWSINSGTGALTAVPGSPFSDNSSAGSIALAP